MDYSKLIEQLEAEIARLEEVRRLLSETGSPKIGTAKLSTKQVVIKKPAKKHVFGGVNQVKHAKKSPTKIVHRRRAEDGEGSGTGDGGYGFTKERF